MLLAHVAHEVHERHRQLQAVRRTALCRLQPRHAHELRLAGAVDELLGAYGLRTRRSRHDALRHAAILLAHVDELGVEQQLHATRQQ